MVIDFDNMDEWEPLLSERLNTLVPTAVVDKFRIAAPETIQDALDLLLDSTCRKAVIDATVEWVRSVTIVGYHGTRLTEAEVESIRSKGLLPLKIVDRRTRIQRALSNHKCWPQVADKLDETLERLARGKHGTYREGQVHLTLSLSGLINGFKQYLTRGSDVDWHIASELLGKEGMELLKEDGGPWLIKVVLPGDKALAAAHTTAGHTAESVEQRQARGKVPHLACEFLASWSYRLADPGFQCSSWYRDCGMILYSKVPPHWIIEIGTPQGC